MLFAPVYNDNKTTVLKLNEINLPTVQEHAKGGKIMATYEYRCEGCNHKFSLVQRISEHGKAKVTCPKCKGPKVKQQISPFQVKTSRKS